MILAGRVAQKCFGRLQPGFMVVYVFVFTADFGFARFLQDGVMAATLCGSPMYMVSITLFYVYF